MTLYAFLEISCINIERKYIFLFPLFLFPILHMNIKRLLILANYLFCQKFTKDSIMFQEGQSTQIVGTLTKSVIISRLLCQTSYAKWFVLYKRFRAFSWKDQRCFWNF